MVADSINASAIAAAMLFQSTAPRARARYRRVACRASRCSARRVVAASADLNGRREGIEVGLEHQMVVSQFASSRDPESEWRLVREQ